MKILCLDVGEKRIGLATADTSVRIAVPHSTIITNGTELKQIARIYLLEKANLLIVGLPRNSKGEETAQSKIVRSFIISLEDFFVKHKLQKPRICYQDESLTSVQAEQNLSRKRRKKIQKGDIDREAATLILQDFLESHHPEMLENMARPVSSAADAIACCKNPMANDCASPKPKKKCKMRSKILKFFTVLVGIIVVAIIAAIAWFYEMSRPASGVRCAETCEFVEFKVERGENTELLAQRLESQNLIKSALAFKINLKLKHRTLTLKSGDHKLSASYNLDEIIKTLATSPAAATYNLTILPGETLYTIKPKLKALGFSSEDIETALAYNYNHPLLADKPKEASLEGYIYGETYELYASASLESVLTKIFDEFYHVIEQNDLKNKFSAKNLNLHEGITLASIIQREAYAPDQPQVAQIFLLRLEKGIPLGSDAVIGYAADQINPNRDKSDMSYLKTTQCPWHSRYCPGLPPTPIAVPSKSTLLAVANPAAGSYLYFLTGDDNKMYYAYTEAEHNQNAKNHCKKMCKIL